MRLSDDINQNILYAQISLNKTMNDLMILDKKFPQKEIR